VLKVGVYCCGLTVILRVIAENVIMLWHNSLVVLNRGVGGKGRGNISGPPPPVVDFEERQNWLQNEYFK